MRANVYLKEWSERTPGAFTKTDTKRRPGGVSLRVPCTRAYLKNHNSLKRAPGRLKNDPLDGIRTPDVTTTHGTEFLCHTSSLFYAPGGVHKICATKKIAPGRSPQAVPGTFFQNKKTRSPRGIRPLPVFYRLLSAAPERALWGGGSPFLTVKLLDERKH